jgi:hypothetical protein
MQIFHQKSGLRKIGGVGQMEHAEQNAGHMRKLHNFCTLKKKFEMRFSNGRSHLITSDCNSDDEFEILEDPIDEFADYKGDIIWHEE